MKKLFLILAVLASTQVVAKESSECQDTKRKIEYYDALINGNALRHDTVFIAKIKLQKQEAERRMFLCKPRK